MFVVAGLCKVHRRPLKPPLQQLQVLMCKLDNVLGGIVNISILCTSSCGVWTWEVSCGALIIFLIVFQDHVLIQLEATGLKGRGRGEDSIGEMVKELDPLLVVHPNYVIDS